MIFHLDTYVAKEEEEEWEIIPVKWWHTPLNAAQWSYNRPKQDPVDRKLHRQYQGSLFHCLSSIEVSPSPKALSNERTVSVDDESLNLDLVGVKSAMEVLMIYEMDVGFHYTDFPDLGIVVTQKVDLSVNIDESVSLAARETWNELLEELMNVPTLESPVYSDSLDSSFTNSALPSGDLRRSTTLSSIDLTRSEGSIDSIPMPSTPKAKASFNDTEVKSPSESADGNGNRSIYFSPGSSLNASASSFVPTFCSQLNEEPLHFPSVRDDPKSTPYLYSSVPASIANFTFPTLNPSPPSVKIKKDDQGFFTEVQVDDCFAQQSGTGLLPPFLQEPPQRSRTRKSRTREIVDRLRSQAAPDDVVSRHFHTISAKCASHSPSPIADERSFMTPRLSVSEDGGGRLSRISSPSYEDEQGDGWIDTAQPAVTSVSFPSQKSKRTRELFLALTRRRTDSSSSGELKDMMASETSSGTSSSRNQSLSPPSSPSPHTPPPLPSKDGWIEGTYAVGVSPPATQKKSKVLNHNRKKSSNHQNSRTTSLSSSTTSPTSLFQQNSFSVPSQPLSTSSASSAFFYPQLSPTGLTHHTHLPYPQQQQQHMLPPQTPFPYFFPAYPALVMPPPYGTAFMQIPTYPVTMGMQQVPMHTATPATGGGAALSGVGMGVNPQVTPTLVPNARGASMKPSMTSTTASMNVNPAHMAKVSTLW